MAAQAASTNNRRVTRSSTSTPTTTTTLTPSTKAYTAPPSSQAIHTSSSSSSSSSAVAPILVEAFASLAAEVPPPQQQQEGVLRTAAEPCSQNASQSAQLHNVIAKQSRELRSMIAVQSDQLYSVIAGRSSKLRSMVTTRPGDLRPQNPSRSAELRSAIAFQSDELHSMIVTQTAELRSLIATRSAEFCSQTDSQSAELRDKIAIQSTELHSVIAIQSAELCSVVATYAIELYSLTAAQLAEPCPLASTRPTGTNRGDDKGQQDPLKSDTKAHSDPVDRLVKDIGDVQIYQLPASMHSQTTSPPVPATPAKQKRGRSDYEESTIDERLANLYLDPPPPLLATLTSASTSASPVIPLSTTTKTTTSTSISHSHPAKTSSSKDITTSADTPANVEAHGEPHQEIPLPHLIERRISRLYHQTKPSPTSDPLADREARQRLKAEKNELVELHTMISILWILRNPGFGVVSDIGQQGNGNKRSKSQLEADEARVDIALHSLRAARQYRKLVAAARACESRQRSEAFKQYMNARSTDAARTELQRKYEQARMESQPKYEQASKELERKYKQASEQCKKSMQDALEKAKQQHRQLSLSHHQTPSQYNQGLEDLLDLASYPLLLRDPGDGPSPLLGPVGGGSSWEDKDKTSESRERRKRVKHDDIKQEPVDEKMSDATTASTPFSTTTSAASTTSTLSTLCGHTIADATVDMQHKLTFNPTTATSQ